MGKEAPILQSDTVPLWRNQDFLKLWSGQTISLFGSLVSRFALPLAAVMLLKVSPVQMSLLRTAEILPGLLMGLLAGVWVDRLPRRPIMIWADWGRAVCLGLIPVLAFLGALRLGYLFGLALVVSVLTVFFDVAYQSYLPALVAEGELVEANAKLQATGSIAEVTGFGLAGLLTQLLTAPGAILVDAVSFIVSAVTLTSIRRKEPPPPPPEARERVWNEAREGLSVVANHPVLRALVGATGIMGFCMNMVGVVFMIYLVEKLKLDPVVMGVIFSVGGIASFLGALAAQRLVGRFGIGHVLIAAVLFWTACAFMVPLAGGPVWAVVAMLVAQQFGDGALTIYYIQETSLRQALAPERVLGRVNATNRVVEWGAMLLGTLLGGVLGQAIGLRSTLFAACAGYLLAALALLLSPVRSLREG